MLNNTHKKVDYRILDLGNYILKTTCSYLNTQTSSNLFFKKNTVFIRSRNTATDSRPHTTALQAQTGKHLDIYVNLASEYNF